MKRLPLFLLLFYFTTTRSQQNSPLISKIAFGSCAVETQAQPILDIVVNHKPDVFIYLGDNIYGDTRSMAELKAKYDSLGMRPEYKRLRENARILATWDDHDFGWNDAEKHYPFKNQSKEIFLDFFNEPANSDRRKHDGIYHSYYFEGRGKRLQVILLDVRTFRNDPRLYRGELSHEEKYFYPMSYYPLEIKDSTLLGEQQWQWLESELKKPADIRIIGSGTQFGITYNGYEAWANFPHEQQRLLMAIKNSKASGVLFITGDSHYSEISKLDWKDNYPIYDITSSGLTETWLFATPNANRIEDPVMDNNFGLLTIDWEKKDIEIKMEIWDVRDNQRIEHTIKLNEISFR